MVYKPLLTRLHKSRRYAFARRSGQWSADQWKRVIFSDEKMVRVRPGGKIRCWMPRTAGRYTARYSIPSVAKAEGLMYVWSAINGRGEIILRRCPPKVNSVEYQTLLGSALPFIRPRCVCMPNPKAPPPLSQQGVPLGIPTRWGTRPPE